MSGIIISASNREPVSLAGRAGPAGTGLGLPIARELARRWGGDVTLANREDGGGARATVTVPPWTERQPLATKFEL